MSRCCCGVGLARQMRNDLLEAVLVLLWQVEPLFEQCASQIAIQRVMTQHASQRFPCRGGVTKRAAVKLMTGAPHPAADDATEVPPLSPAPTPVRHVAFTLISVAIVVLLLQLMQSVLIPFVLGGLLFYTLDPAVDRFQKMPVPRALGAAVMLLIVVTGLRGAGLPATRPGADRHRSVVRRLAQAGGHSMESGQPAMIRSRRQNGQEDDRRRVPHSGALVATDGPLKWPTATDDRLQLAI